MKLYEIPNYLDKKIAKNNSIPRNFKYIYFENGIWKDQHGVVYNITSFEIEHNDWEELKEVSQRKRFWKWIINIDGVKRTNYYIDNNGLDSVGEKPLLNNSEWDKIKKKKLENDFIDCILVNGKWELEE